MNAPIAVQADGLRMVFDRRVVFDGVRFVLAGMQTLLISGRNGAGKSTLVKIIAGVLTPTAGSVIVSGPGSDGIFGVQSLLGLVSPYLALYEEFSAEENLKHIAAIRGLQYDREVAHDLLRRVALLPRKDDPVRTYSSGMKQRAKYAAALLHRPPLLILDEPMSNLDTDGVAIVREVMAEHRREGLLIVATNDLSDVDRFDERVDLNALR
jgi:heme exporter protein A